MVDKTLLVRSIKENPQVAAKALDVLRLSGIQIATYEGFATIAGIRERKIEEEIARDLEEDKLSEKFVQALRAQGIVIGLPAVKPPSANWRVKEFNAFLSRYGETRCLVRVNGKAAGSGCLIGPSLALTAWHVVEAGRPPAPPYTPAPPFAPVEVEFSDGKKLRGIVRDGSPCTREEFDGEFPANDDAFRDCNDMALVRLERPEGVHRGRVELPATTPELTPRAPIILFHFAGGEDSGFQPGRVDQIPDVKSRWKHDMETAAGSSGGPCFDQCFNLVGIHQGRLANSGGRLIPIYLFLDKLRISVAEDRIPPTLWSLDGTPEGKLVIGRDLFFEAVAAAATPTGPVRGVHVRRQTASKKQMTGLTFSFEMLEKILGRDVESPHRTLRIEFQPPYLDLLDGIAKQARAAGWTIVGPAKAAAGSATRESSVDSRASALASALNAAAGRRRQFLWLMVDGPSVPLTEDNRLAVEFFIAAGLRQPNLRFLITGFETVPSLTPGFTTASPPTGVAPGLVQEWLGSFGRGDVKLLLKRACEDFGWPTNDDELEFRTKEILRGIERTNDVYDLKHLEKVAKRAIRQLQSLREDQ